MNLGDILENTLHVMCDTVVHLGIIITQTEPGVWPGACLEF